LALQQKGKKPPLSGIAYIQKTIWFAFMKLLSESIRNFWEGFISFYTSIYNEMKSW